MDLRALLGILVISTLGGPGGCDQTCTDAGCPSVVQILIEGPDGAALPDSTYEIILDVGGSVYSTACGSPEPGVLRCEPVEGAADFRVVAGFTTSGAIILAVQGAGAGDVGSPAVSLQVVAGDAPLVDETWNVTYETTHPNGEDCAPSCRVATETLHAVVDVPNG